MAVGGLNSRVNQVFQKLGTSVEEINAGLDPKRALALLGKAESVQLNDIEKQDLAEAYGQKDFFAHPSVASRFLTFFKVDHPELTEKDIEAMGGRVADQKTVSAQVASSVQRPMRVDKARLKGMMERMEGHSPQEQAGIVALIKFFKKQGVIKTDQGDRTLALWEAKLKKASPNEDLVAVCTHGFETKPPLPNALNALCTAPLDQLFPVVKDQKTGKPVPGDDGKPAPLYLGGCFEDLIMALFINELADVIETNRREKEKLFEAEKDATEAGDDAHKEKMDVLKAELGGVPGTSIDDVQTVLEQTIAHVDYAIGPNSPGGVGVIAPQEAKDIADRLRLLDPGVGALVAEALERSLRSDDALCGQSENLAPLGEWISETLKKPVDLSVPLSDAEKSVPNEGSHKDKLSYAIAAYINQAFSPDVPLEKKQKGFGEFFKMAKEDVNVQSVLKDSRDHHGVVDSDNPVVKEKIEAAGAQKRAAAETMEAQQITRKISELNANMHRLFGYVAELSGEIKKQVEQGARIQT